MSRMAPMAARSPRRTQEVRGRSHISAKERVTPPVALCKDSPPSRVSDPTSSRGTVGDTGADRSREARSVPRSRQASPADAGSLHVRGTARSLGVKGRTDGPALTEDTSSLSREPAPPQLPDLRAVTRACPHVPPVTEAVPCLPAGWLPPALQPCGPCTPTRSRADEAASHPTATETGSGVQDRMGPPDSVPGPRVRRGP